MEKATLSQKNAKALLRMAEQTAAGNDPEKAIELFEECIREYLKDELPFKALAAAKIARTVLNGYPKAHSMLFKVLIFMGLQGDACKEYTESSLIWKKNEVSLFKGLTMEEFMGLLGIIDLIAVKKGSCIVREKDKGEDIFIVFSGSLEVIRDGVRLAVMHPGEVFGELGFFSQGSRSATVRAVRKCELARIPSRKLRNLWKRYPGLEQSLEELYLERVLKKAREDLGLDSIFTLCRKDITTLHYEKGRRISFDGTDKDVTILKHGIIEISYDDKGLPMKRFLRPGNVLELFLGIAHASTDVELIRSRIDYTGLEIERKES